MLEGKLEDLITAQHVQAFRDLWTVDGEDAREDFLRILSMFSEPLDRDEIARFVARVVMGLVADGPDPVAWLEAHAAGSFAASRTGLSETPAQLRKRARALARRSGLFLSNIEGYRRAWADDATKAQDEVRLLIAIAVGKELRKNVAAKAALGPAWPLMVAVNDYFTNKEKRALYFYGADNRFQTMIAEAVREALERFTEYHADPTISPPETADWTREIPPGADVHEYFRGKSREAECSGEHSRVQDAEAGNIETTADASATSAQTKIASVGPENRPFSYKTLPDGTLRTVVCNDERSAARLRAMMPLLAKRAQPEEMLVLAARADARHMWGPRFVRGHFDFQLAAEVRDWIRDGYAPPSDLRPEHAHLFEEEACSAYFDKPSALRDWQSLGFFRYLPEAEPEATTPILQEWLRVFILGKTDTEAD